ncbi:fibrous sheath CABYR-binding protein-like [Helianthus annuus]|uniref:fibrous sheath CABYR-binding protein-like n=1 Tax=Helianthus annuus TaxID=4232 RepID=UPI0016532750|nr:fibrous sheath CABYR-binding protein-like [Helianthus annuus]
MLDDKITKQTPPVWSQYKKNVPERALELKRMKEELITANYGSRNQITRWIEVKVLETYKRLEERRKKDPTVPKKPDYSASVVSTKQTLPIKISVKPIVPPAAVFYQRKKQKQMDEEEKAQEAYIVKVVLQQMFAENPDPAKLQDVAKRVINIMPSSSDTGVSDTLDPMAIVSDDRVSLEREVYTSDTTSTDDDDFQPFALPDVGVEPADGLPVGDLPLAVIPAPIPLAAYPVVDMPLDVVSDDDIDLFEEDPPEADHQGGAPIVADVILPIAEAPAEELPTDSPVPDSFESVASASIHTQGVQHHSADADPDMALSAAPAPAHDFEFDHDPAVAPEPLAAPDPALEHDPVHDDAPVIAPFVDDAPIADAPVEAPLLIEDPVVAPFPDSVPVLFDRAPFATHVDPRYADIRNGWIDDDDDYEPFVRPVTPPVAPVSAPISAPTDIPLIPPHITDAHRIDLPFTFL